MKHVKYFKYIWSKKSIYHNHWQKFQLEGARESAYLRQVKWFKHYYKERGGRRNSCFTEEGKSISRHRCLCCWCNDVIAIISHHVHTQKHTRNDGQNNQSLNLLQCSLRSLGGDNYLAPSVSELST